MSPRPLDGVAIRPWSEEDGALLQRLLGDPALTEHIGGPETPDAIRARHARYLASDPAHGGLFAIVVGPGADAVGWVGYWESDWRGETVWECGWSVLAEAQRRGAAATATALMLRRMRAHGIHRFVHAFPSVHNEGSNALCRRVGFRSLGEVQVEYPPGTMMRSNDWCIDLQAT